MYVRFGVVFYQDKLGEAVLTASYNGTSGHSKFLLQRGASVNYQRKVRVLYNKARQFGGELK